VFEFTGECETGENTAEVKRSSNLESEKENKSESVKKVVEKRGSERKEFGGGDAWPTSVCGPVDERRDDDAGDLDGEYSSNESPLFAIGDSVALQQRHDLLNNGESGKELEEVSDSRPSGLSKNTSPLDVETNELIQNSRVLIQTVSRTLEEQREKILPSTSVIADDSKQVTGVDLLKKEAANTSCELETDQSDQTKTKTSDAKKSAKLNLFMGMNSMISATTANTVSCDLEEDCNVSSPNDEECCKVLVRTVPICCIKVWAAEMVIALEKLHTQGITFGYEDTF
jgi:hypothetical protein